MKKFVFALSMLLSGTVNASTLFVSGLDTARGGNVDFKENGTDVNGYAGAIFAAFDGIDVTPLFCVDLFTNISVPSTVNSTPIAPTGNQTRAAWLYVNQLSTVTDAIAGMAFQLAIWDIMHDNGDGIASGSVQAAATTPLAVATAWTNYLTLSLGQSLSTGVSIYQNTNISDGSPAQNLIGAPAPTPEPGTWALVAIGMAGMAVRKRRKITA
jgi:hypothetical protein